MFRQKLVQRFLHGSVHFIKQGFLSQAELLFLSEFFDVSVDEWFDEQAGEFKRVIVLKRRKKFLPDHLTI